MNQQQQTAKAPRLLRLPSVLEKVALSRTELHRRISAGTFPKPLKLGARSVAWTEASIDAWIQSLEESVSSEQ